jgi:hypothetical protein
MFCLPCVTFNELTAGRSSIKMPIQSRCLSRTIPSAEADPTNSTMYMLFESYWNETCRQNLFRIQAVSKDVAYSATSETAERGSGRSRQTLPGLGKTDSALSTLPSERRHGQ